jgi:hypothetical protein
MAEEERIEHRKQHGHYGFIPAGVLIGLGVGLLAGYPGSGVLIGLGIGFLASGLTPLVKRPLEAEGLQPGGTNVTMLLLGVFMIFIGIGIVWAPAVLWPYAIAGFLILMGIWFLARGFFRIS